MGESADRKSLDRYFLNLVVRLGLLGKGVGTNGAGGGGNLYIFAGCFTKGADRFPAGGRYAPAEGAFLFVPSLN